MAVLKTYTPRASAAVWHSDSDAMTWLPVHAVADRRYAWLRATSTRARSRQRIQDSGVHIDAKDAHFGGDAQIFRNKSNEILVIILDVF